MTFDDETILPNISSIGSNTRRIKPVEIEYEDNRPPNKLIVLKEVEDAAEINRLEFEHNLISDIGVAATIGGRTQFEDSLAFSLPTGSNEGVYASFVVSDGVSTSIQSKMASIYTSQKLVLGLQEGRDQFPIIEEISSDLNFLREEITEQKLDDQFEFIERLHVDEDDAQKPWFKRQLEILGIGSSNGLNPEDYIRVRESIINLRKAKAQRFISNFKVNRWGRNGYEEDEKEFLGNYQKSLQTTTTGVRLIATGDEGAYKLETITFGDPKVYRFRQEGNRWKMERLSRGTSVDNDLWEYSEELSRAFTISDPDASSMPAFHSDNSKVNEIYRGNYQIFSQLIGKPQTSRRNEFHFEKFLPYLRSLTISKPQESDFQRNSAFDSKSKTFSYLFNYLFENEIADEGLFKRIMSNRNKVYQLLRMINWDNIHNVYATVSPTTDIEYPKDKYYSMTDDIRSGDVILLSSDDDEDIPYDRYEELVSKVMYQDHPRHMQHLAKRIHIEVSEISSTESRDNGVKLAFQVK